MSVFIEKPDKRFVLFKANPDSLVVRVISYPDKRLARIERLTLVG